MITREGVLCLDGNIRLQFMNFRKAWLGKRAQPLNVIRMVFVLSTMPTQTGFNGWRSSFDRRAIRGGNWFNRGTRIGNSFVYGRREEKARRADGICPLPD
jgi:hypothetical protein